jgi:hypothetical protein
MERACGVCVEKNSTDFIPSLRAGDPPGMSLIDRPITQTKLVSHSMKKNA